MAYDGKWRQVGGVADRFRERPAMQEASNANCWPMPLAIRDQVSLRAPRRAMLLAWIMIIIALMFLFLLVALSVFPSSEFLIKLTASPSFLAPSSVVNFLSNDYCENMKFFTLGAQLLAQLAVVSGQTSPSKPDAAGTDGNTIIKELGPMLSKGASIVLPSSPEGQALQIRASTPRIAPGYAAIVEVASEADVQTTVWRLSCPCFYLGYLPFCRVQRFSLISL